MTLHFPLMVDSCACVRDATGEILISYWQERGGVMRQLIEAANRSGDLQREIERLRAELDRWRTAKVRHAERSVVEAVMGPSCYEHGAGCPHRKSQSNPCECGLTDVLATRHKLAAILEAGEGEG